MEQSKGPLSAWLNIVHLESASERDCCLVLLFTLHALLLIFFVYYSLCLFIFILHLHSNGQQACAFNAGTVGTCGWFLVSHHMEQSKPPLSAWLNSVHRHLGRIFVITDQFCPPLYAALEKKHAVAIQKKFKITVVDAQPQHQKEESVCWITCGDYNLGRLLILMEGTVQALCTRC
eukprot:scaffold392_cov113-Skeletonema_menzelii.AAC.3